MMHAAPAHRSRRRGRCAPILRSTIVLGLLVICSASALAAEEVLTPAVASTPAAGYRLYPGDLLRIQVYDHPDLTVDIRVPADGQLTFPLIGRLPGVNGLTSDALADRLKMMLEDGYIRQAVVTIAVIEFGARRAYLMGSVVKPGYVDIPPFASLTAVQAIGQVGGFSEDADRSAAQVIRDDAQNPGLKASLAVPATDGPAALQKDVVLLPGDLVIVPRLDRVYIIGQVRKPGAVNLPSQEALTVSKAISVAGGFERFARKDDVQLLRTGQPVQIISVDRILSGNAQVEDPVLRGGDTVFVPESRF